MPMNRPPASLRVRISGLRQRAARRKFAWNVLVMMAGTVTAQTISLLLAPVLTRLFTPDQFGYLSVYGAALMIVGVIASLGLELAIPICMDDRRCANLLA